MAFSIPSITLVSNGAAVPVVGLGTAVFPLDDGVVEEAVMRAIEIGYRHFDTALVYKTEKAVGEAVTRALETGLIESRAELFITSKLWTSDAHPHLVVSALRNTLRNLGLEYLDLFLIHWPVSSNPGNHEFLIYQDDELMPMDFKAVWEAMEECHKLGLTKAIGVSNFSCKKLQTVLNTATIPPAVNQVEMNPYWQQKQLREFCKEKGIHITAYSPLGGKGTIWGSSQVMDSEILHEIAKNKGKTVAQVCLRWAYEQGVSIVVKSFNGERMKENLKIFDWELSKEDLLKIEQIRQKRGVPAPFFVREKGPYKSMDELWDDEIAELP